MSALPSVLESSETVMDGRGRICLVTGANRGLGLSAATELARRGAHVVLVCRSASTGKRAMQRVRHDAASDEVEFLAADLSSQESIRAMADRFHQRYGSLHVLIHNAAAIPPSRRMTPDGMEEQFAVNHLAPFLLTHLLLGKLRDSTPARIVVVASQMEREGKIRFDNLTSAGSYDPVAAYCQSKLANVLFTYRLAETLRGTGVTANCLHPGVIDTKLLETLYLADRARGLGLGSRHIPWLRFVQRGRTTLGLFLRSIGVLKRPVAARQGPVLAEEAAAYVVRLALDPSLKAVTGKYFAGQSQGVSSEASRDQALADRLWEASASLVGLRSSAEYGGSE